MLDTTGSMSGQKIIDMRNAATNLVNTVVRPAQTPFYSKLALVPFSIGVDAGAYASAVRGICHRLARDHWRKLGKRRRQGDHGGGAFRRQRHHHVCRSRLCEWRHRLHHRRRRHHSAQQQILGDLECHRHHLPGFGSERRHDLHSGRLGDQMSGGFLLGGGHRQRSRARQQRLHLHHWRQRHDPDQQRRQHGLAGVQT